ncbi:MAG: SRPBCC domain-containing protein [bacterium]|nr:SRPBCC domain-containing protein [bacterium]
MCCSRTEPIRIKTAFLIVGVLLGLLVLAGLVLYFLGRSLPERHTARVSVVLPGARAKVWAIITDYQNMAAWWPAVKGVRLETRLNGEVWTWNKDSHDREIAYRTKEEQAPAKLVREIVADDLPFGGTWTFELTEDGGQTRLTLTEDGFIKPPLFRAIMQYFIGSNKTMKDFAANLAQRVAAK